MKEHKPSGAPELSKVRHIDAEAYQLSNIAHKNIATLAGIEFQSGPNNTRYIIDLMLDAMARNDIFGKQYFGTLWENQELQDKIATLRSEKKPYDKALWDKQLQLTLDELFLQQQKKFEEYVNQDTPRLRQKCILLKEQVKQLKSTSKQQQTAEVSPHIAPLKEQIQKRKSVLKKIDPTPPNKEAIMQFQHKIAQANEQITQILKQNGPVVDEQNQQSLLNRLQETENELQSLERIVTGKDTTSPLYQTFRSKFMATLQNPAGAQVAQHMLSQEEDAFQHRFQDWMTTMLEQYILPPRESAPQSTLYAALLRDLQARICSPEFILPEHMFSRMIELIQLHLLSEVLPQLYLPKQKARVYLAPLLDDMTGGVDCLIKLDSAREELYFPIDLKNSENMTYIQEEARNKSGKKGTLYGTAHELNIPTSELEHDETHVLYCSEAVAYTVWLKVMQKLFLNQSLPPKLSDLIDPFVYEKVEQAVREHRKSPQTISATSPKEATEQNIVSQLTHILRAA